MQFRWRKGRVHQRRGRSDPRGTEHRRYRQDTSGVDESYALAGQVGIGQTRGAFLDGHSEVAIADGAAVDDQGRAAGVAGGRVVDDVCDVHASLNTGVTTRRSAAADWSTGRATRARHTSTSLGRGARGESRSEEA